MLRWRLILGVLFAAVFIGLCWLDAAVVRPGALLWPVALVLSWLGVAELLAMFGKRGRRPLPWVLYGGVFLALVAAGLPVLWPPAAAGHPLAGLGWLAIALAAGLLLAFVGELSRYDPQRPTTVNLGLSAFVLLYLGGLMGCAVQVRLLGVGGGPTGDGRWGMLALVALIVTVKTSDVGQYAVGRLLGRRKLAPRVSPGKTWEGALGGIVFAVLAAWLMLTWGARQILGTAAPSFHPAAIVLFAVAVAVAGILGDLAESLLKRDAEVKDSSTWMPGYGGVLDMLDSLLAAAPVAYTFWLIKGSELFN